MHEDDAPDTTSLCLRRALEGDAGQWGPLIERLTPLLELQARYRLRGPLQSLYDPSDLVNDVWTIVLTRTPELVPSHGRLLPVFIRYLGTTLLRHTNNLLRKHAQRQVGLDLDGAQAPGTSPSAILRQVERSETCGMVRALIGGLSPEEQEVLVLHGIEGLRVAVVAQRLGLDEGVVSRRYKRALSRLREAFPSGMPD